MERSIEKAKVLIEALPYIRSFSGKTFVIKYGGKAMTEASLKERFAQDVSLMKYVGIHPVIVHGGGPQINEMMRRLGQEPRFVKGVRVTNPETMEIVEMVLGGVINKEIVSLINQNGGRAIGLTGKDGKLFTAQPVTKRAQKGPGDMGMTGRVKNVDPLVLEDLHQKRFIPVIAPIGFGENGVSYNINADLVAGALASALQAEKLLILTDVKGIRDKDSKFRSILSKKRGGTVHQTGYYKGRDAPQGGGLYHRIKRGL